MESQLPRTQGHHYEESDLSGNSAELNSGVQGHSEGHQEKPSIMKRMKAKAKKIRNTLTGHGHDHDHSQSHSQSHEEEEEEEEMVEDPEIHGAPIYEATADKGATRASGGQSATGGSNFDSPPSMVDPHYDSPVVDTEPRPFVQRQADEDDGKHLVKEDKHAPVPSKLVDMRSGEDIFHELPVPMEGILGGMGTTNYEVDPQAPDIRAHPSNVQIKTIDPAAREEKPKQEQGNREGLYTGSHNQFDPEAVPSESSDSFSKGYNAANPLDMPSSESSESFPKSYSAGNPQDMPKDVFDPASQSSTYTKNAVASKIGQMREPGEDNKPGEGNKSGSVMETDKGVSRKEYLVEKLKLGEEDKALSSMITDSFRKPKGEKMEEVHSGGGGELSISQIVSNAVHKREPEESIEGKPMGKVTESKEVVKRLGTGEEDKVLSSMITEKPNGEKMEEVSDVVHKGELEESEQGKTTEKVTESEEVAKRLGTGGEQGSGVENVGSGGGMVSMLTGAIGSWFGGAQSTPGTTLADDNEENMGKKNAADERRLQE